MPREKPVADGRFGITGASAPRDLAHRGRDRTLPGAVELRSKLFRQRRVQRVAVPGRELCGQQAARNGTDVTAQLNFPGRRARVDAHELGGHVQRADYGDHGVEIGPVAGAGGGRGRAAAGMLSWPTVIS